MKLVIVESPAKAKTINKYLGSDYEVMASVGHVRDLPAKDGSVDVENDFSMIWEIDKKAEKNLKEITSLAKKADEILLATDQDREGEAISWHVLEILEMRKALNGTPVKRVVFNQITKSAIHAAVENPRELDQSLIEAYLARRALDYLVGFNLSPVLWRKLPGSRSAGRVQSVALRLITDRENEIEAFKPQEYWSVLADVKGSAKKKFETRLTHHNGKKLDKMALGDQGAADAAVKAIEAGSFSVSKVERKEVKRHPSPPFITSTLQQEAARKLGFSATRTMRTAQSLYEGVEIGEGERTGLITYMRTDSVHLAPEAVDETRTFIKQEFGDKYLPESAKFYKSKSKNAQEAHEAIRPTHSARDPNSIKSYLDDDQFKLYKLIWKRMVSCQMTSAILDQVTVDIMTPDQQTALRATGSTVKFDGFWKVYREGEDDKDEEQENILPPVEQGEAISIEAIKPNQHFTQPPPRYTEASLVKKMEELGIGRPSTYASIIRTLQDRNYVNLEKKRFFPLDRGRLVTAFLVNFFEKYVQFDFTAGLEEQLDEISSGKLAWKDVLNQFWEKFNAAIGDAKELRITEVIDKLDHDLEHMLYHPDGDKDVRTCPKCATGRLSLKLGKFGAFIGCSNYPECQHTQKIGKPEEETEDQEKPEKFEPKELGTDPKTGDVVTLRQGPYGFYFQWGEKKGKEKPKRVSLPKGQTPDDADLELALSLNALPRSLGKHPETGDEITAGKGRYGPYLKYQGKFKSVKGDDDILTMTLDRAVELLS